MTRLFKNVFIVLFLCTIADVAAGRLLDYLRDHSPDGRYYKAKYSLEDCKEDIVIIGSSRAEINYVPAIFEDSLRMACWNAGRGGQGLPYFRAIQEGILARYTPKIVLLNVEDYLLEKKPYYEEAGFIRPFYRNHKEIRPILNKISFYERFLLWSKLYAYNSSFYYLIRPYFFHNIDGKVSDKGWKPRQGAVEINTGEPLVTESIDDPLQQESVQEFETFIKKFLDKGCHVFVVISPNCNRNLVTSTSNQHVESFCKKHNVPVYKYSNDLEWVTKPELFVDPDHLNVEGAQLFTKMIASRMKKDLQANGLTVLNK